MGSWLDPTFIASAIAAVGGVVSAWIGAAVYLRSLKDDIPKIGVDTKVFQEPRLHIQVSLRYINTSEIEWHSTHFEILAPTGWHVLHDTKVPRGTYAGWQFDKVNIDALPRSCALNFRMVPLAIYEDRRLHVEQVHLFPPRPASEVRISMRVSLRSIEPIQRRKAVTIKRQLKLTASTATA